MNIVKFEPRVNNNSEELVRCLQGIIDDVKSGKVTGYVAMAISHGEAEFHFVGTTYHEDIVYTAMLHDIAMKRSYT